MKATFQSKYAGQTIHIDEVEVPRGTKKILSLKKIQFVNHVFTTEKAEEIEFLRNHTGLGTDYFEVTPADQKVVKEAQGKVEGRRAPSLP